MLIVGGELYCEIFSQIFSFFFQIITLNLFLFFQLFFGLCLKLFFQILQIFVSKYLFKKTALRQFFKGVPHEWLSYSII